MMVAQHLPLPRLPLAAAAVATDCRHTPLLESPQQLSLLPLPHWWCLPPTIATPHWFLPVHNPTLLLLRIAALHE